MWLGEQPLDFWEYLAYALTPRCNEQNYFFYKQKRHICSSESGGVNVIDHMMLWSSAEMGY